MKINYFLLAILEHQSYLAADHCLQGGVHASIIGLRSLISAERGEESIWRRSYGESGDLSLRDQWPVPVCTRWKGKGGGGPNAHKNTILNNNFFQILWGHNWLRLYSNTDCFNKTCTIASRHRNELL